MFDTERLQRAVEIHEQPEPTDPAAAMVRATLVPAGSGSARVPVSAAVVRVAWADGLEADFDGLLLFRHGWPTAGGAEVAVSGATPPHEDPASDRLLSSRCAHRWEAGLMSELAAAAVAGADPGTDPRVDEFPLAQWAALAGDDSQVASALGLLRRWGFLLVHGLEPTEPATEAACRRLCAGGRLQRTLWGDGMWRTEIALSGTDTAYTGVPLPPHSDGNYMGDLPGLQVFHAVTADATGAGESLLVDGFAVCEWLWRHHRDTFRFLATHELAFHHTDGAERLLQLRRPIELFAGGGPSGLAADEPDAPMPSVRRFSYNDCDRAPLSASVLPWLRDSEQQAACYRHLRALTTAMRLPELQVWFHLRPGTALFFNNARVLHGRSGFSTQSSRVLVGAYVSEEAWRAQLRRASGWAPF